MSDAVACCYSVHLVVYYPNKVKWWCNNKKVLSRYIVIIIQFCILFLCLKAIHWCTLVYPIRTDLIDCISIKSLVTSPRIGKEGGSAQTNTKTCFVCCIYIVYCTDSHSHRSAMQIVRPRVSVTAISDSESLAIWTWLKKAGLHGNWAEHVYATYPRPQNQSHITVNMFLGSTSYCDLHYIVELPQSWFPDK